MRPPHWRWKHGYRRTWGPRPLGVPYTRLGRPGEVLPDELTGFTDTDRTYLCQLSSNGNRDLAGAMTPARFRRLAWPLLDNTATVESWLNRRYLQSLRENRARRAASEAA